MTTVRYILASILSVYVVLMWSGHYQHVTKRISFQYSTGFQLIVITLLALGLWLGASLWFVPLVLLLWFLFPLIVSEAKSRSIWSPLNPANILTAFGFLTSISISIRQDWGVWYSVLAGVIAVFFVQVLIEVTFPNLPDDDDFNKKKEEQWVLLMEGDDFGDLQSSSFIAAVQDFFIPDKISFDKFHANWSTIYGHYYSEEPVVDMKATSSIWMFLDVNEFPLAYPLWFVAGYPDVVRWATEYFREERRAQRLFRDAALEEVLDENHKMKHEYLRMILTEYKEVTSKGFECA